MKGILTALVACALGCVLHGLAAEAQTETVLYSFNGYLDGDGYAPVAPVIDVNGTLYGTTEAGGTGCYAAPGCGTVFSLDSGTGAETVLYSFTGVVGMYPEAGMIDVDGTLYGTAYSGGVGCEYGCGSVFSLNVQTDAVTALYLFCDQDPKKCKDGHPTGSVINAGSMLYGTTYAGGGRAWGEGAVFSLDLANGEGTVLHSFNGKGKKGGYPWAGVIDVNGTLYGTTYAGGTGSCVNDGTGCGTVFSIDPQTGAEKVLHYFGSGTDGRYPQAGLIDVGGTLYGTTDSGGTGSCGDNYGCGTVFSLNPKTHAETVLYSFQENGTDGRYPEAGLVDVNGTLYGTTSAGGSGSCENDGDGVPGCGTVFSIDPQTGAETVVYSFAGSPDGASPEAGLIDVNGTLYGTTFLGGSGSCDSFYSITGCGTVFSIVP